MWMNALSRPLVSGGACTSFEYGYARNVSLTMTMITGARYLQMPFYCTQRTHAIVYIYLRYCAIGECAYYNGGEGGGGGSLPYNHQHNYVCVCSVYII